MAYSQENPYIKKGSQLQHLAGAGKRLYDQPYTNGFPSNHTHFDSSPVNYIQFAPNDHPSTQQHAIHQPRPVQSVQVVIPSPRQTLGTASLGASNGFIRSPVTASGPLPVDFQLLLLSLAEEYFATAHDEGPRVALCRRQSDIQVYHKLIATGLGCLEVALKKWRLQPLLEANIRLRYATVLHDETENSMEAEEALSKGITICDRLRNFDLKYNMQHLQARILYRRNARAALRYLDGVIGDVEAYQHVAWIYAFRFLRVSLSFDSSSPQDILSAVIHLRVISTLSDKYRDKAILALAAVLEALAHLRLPHDLEYMEQAQRALAVARSSQLHTGIGHVPQLTAMIHFVDLCWTLRNADPVQLTQKLQALQASLESVHDGHPWTDNGSFAIPTSHTQGALPASHAGIIQDTADGTQNLLFSWVPRKDIYNLGFLLSGVCTAHKNTVDGFKAEQMLQEGIRRLEANTENADKIPQPLSHAISHGSWLQLQKFVLQLHLTFTFCARTSWSAALDQFSSLKKTLNLVKSGIPVDLHMTVQYLEGVINQGTGLLDNALNIFLSPLLSLPEPGKPAPSQNHLDISILAALNSLLIIRSHAHPPIDTTHFINRLGPLCSENPSKAISSAYNLVLATVPSDDTIVHNKQCLQNSLQAAKACANNQLMCLTLNFMSWKFFRGVVGQQAEKSARASQTLAQKGKDVLWMSVSAGLLADTLEIQGRADDAQAIRDDGRKYAATLPDAVQSFATDDG